MAKSRHRRKAPRRTGSVTGNARLRTGLADASALVTGGRMREASQRLAELHRQYPDSFEALNNLAYVSDKLEEQLEYLRCCRKLREMRPEDPHFAHTLIYAHGKNSQQALAMREVGRFLEQWPDHPEAARMRELHDDLVRTLNLIREDVGLSAGDEAALEMHEELQLFLSTGDYVEGEALGRQLIARYPQFIAPYNNLSLVLYFAGRSGEAADMARRVLEMQPDNFQALGNLARILCLSGQEAEARTFAARLKSLRSDNTDIWLKKAETFSFLADDAAVMEIYEEGQEVKAVAGNAIFHHLGAAAAARLGRETEARAAWARALELMPGLDLAR
ncbi:MAG: tetratricopeptide repeat protein, partial [Blastocatellia bacterium]